MHAINETARPAMDAGDSLARAASWRATWMRWLTKWHWVSSALSLFCMLFFALSGITLNNAEYLESTTTAVVQHTGVLPKAVLDELNAQPDADGVVLPESLNAWLRANWRLAIYPKLTERNPDEIFIDLKRPGVDASLSVDRKSGAIQYQAEDHGWVAYFNDLHKGKNAGRVWSWFITLFGVGCVIFSVTGLLILQLHARARWTVWPVTVFGLLLPLLLILLHVR